jgi:hypothetical protein
LIIGEDDGRLLGRAKALRVEGLEVLRLLNLEEVFYGFGVMETCGSVVSGLMVWRDLDVMFTAPDVGADEVLRAMGRLVARSGVIALDYRDERAERRPTPSLEDERYYVVCGYQRSRTRWKIDITIWLHDVWRPMRDDAERLARVTLEQRLAILRLKDFWHREPGYPYQVGGTEIYTAVLDFGVRSAEEFTSHLRRQDLLDPPS